MIQVHEPEQQHPSIKLYRLITIGFVTLAAITAIFSLYMVLVRAQIVVLSQQRDTEAELLVDVATRPSDKEIAGGVYQLTKSATQTFSTSSVVTVEMSAEGRVRISSTLYRDQTLIASTRLLTNDGDILFRIKDTVVVPGLGSVEVAVFSDEVGAVGELPIGTEFTIPGLNEETRKFFTVKSINDMAGGRKDVHLVTSSDLEKSEKTLVDRLQSEIAESLRTKAREDGVPMTGELFNYEIVSSTSDIEIGEEAVEFTLTVSIDGQAVFYERSSFDGQVRELLADRLPFDRLLSRFDARENDLKIEKVDLIGKRANIRVKARGSSILSASAAGLDPNKLIGITIEAATEYLESLDGVSSASIKMRPFWVRRLPNNIKHIQIEVR
jgi:hypothetical protein